MSVIDFYNKLFTSMGYIVEENGLISKDFCGNKSNIIIKADDKEKTLILPTKQFLDNPNWDAHVPFHPLSENVVKGESLIIKELKRLMEHRFADVITTLMMELSIIAADKSGHKKLTVPQKKFLSLMPEANDKTVTVLGKILCNLSNKGERKICSLYIKRGGSIDGKSFKRLAVVSFPITEELNKEEKTIFDVKVSTAEKNAIKNLFGWIIENVDVQGFYNFGSNDETAPNFHALCGAYMKLMSQLNAKIELFKHHEEIGNLYRELNWDVEFNDLQSFYGQIPIMPHNDGEGAKVGNTQGAVMTTTVSAPIVSAPFNQPPVAPFGQLIQPTVSQPIEETEEGKTSWNSIVSRNPALANPSFNPMMPFQQPTPPGGFAGYDRGMPVYGNGAMSQSMPMNFGNTGRI